ncbi:hypothetical protein AB6A40_007736 [Gnathostoma spinigerum]|uniref:Proteasomal ubiquitin receptor ADRM1 homolog n=1 Tax=Gnathostoma spinigerum TaxID=75299 RepID=A0ABD6EPB3_9BILA
MSVMFANASTNQGTGGYLLGFKAGRMRLQSGSTADKRKVVADKTKGLVFIQQSSDQLMHFCWKNRQENSVDEDLIIFPGDTEFIRVKECTDGRVYMLKFKTNDERRLFWMQEGKTDKDEEYCKKVNELLNNPPSARAGGRGNTERGGSVSQFGSLAGLSGSSTDADIGRALGSLNQAQFMQLLSIMNHSGAGRGSSNAASLLPQLSLVSERNQSGTESATASAQVSTPSNTPANGTVTENAASSNAVQLSELNDIIASITPDGRKNNPVELSDVLTGDNVLETVRNHEDRLLPHLPNQEPVIQNREELEQTVRAPQYRQAVDIFGQAFRMGQLSPVFQQFGIPPDVSSVAQSGEFLKFAEKLTEAEQNEGKKTEEGSSGTQKQNKSSKLVYFSNKFHES